MNNENKPVKQLVSVRLDPALVKDIQHLRIDLGKSFTALVEEALRDILRKHSK
ncbi:MAG: CopG family transcriptional regulator [Deltaproteobacteria bacterium]|nr:CopG family transcriptional regulator [Deltaproteobacteria bacterium]TLN00916.1 MAG: CopG family transcriptional regulator [bacterium]